jgi:amidase
MAIQPPSREQLEAIAARYGLDLSPGDLESYGTFAAGLLGSWDRVELRYAERAPQAPYRAWQRPDEAQNRLGAWYVRTEITEGGDGPLAGRTVAIKDNVMVPASP